MPRAKIVTHTLALGGEAWLRAVLGHPVFATIAKVLETEKGLAPDGRAWDVVNSAQLAQWASVQVK